MTSTTNAYIRAAALTTDGSLLAFSLNATDFSFTRIQVIDTATGRTLTSMDALNPRAGTREAGAIDSLTFDAAGRNLLWISDVDGSLHLADPRTGALRKSRPLCAPGGGERARVAWSPNGATIAAWCAPDSELLLLAGETCEPLWRRPRSHRGNVFSLAFSPDSRRLLSSGYDGITRVWEVATGRVLGELAADPRRALCATYSPDGRRIATGGGDNNVRLWDAETFDLVARLSGHQEYVYSLVWRADSQLLVSGSGDHTVRVRDTRPTRDWVQARRERQDILAAVEPMVGRLFSELSDADKVVERVKADPTLSQRARQVALQVVLRMSLDRINAAAQPHS